MTTETRTEHTPGPWRIGEKPTGEAHPWIVGERDMERAIFGADSIKLAVCEQWYGEPESAEAEANARLIASAPELLAALEALRGDLLRYPNDDAKREMIINAADDAIAKARGDA